jgi:hypothetical protein
MQLGAMDNCYFNISHASSYREDKMTNLPLCIFYEVTAMEMYGGVEIWLLHF